MYAVDHSLHVRERAGGQYPSFRVPRRSDHVFASAEVAPAELDALAFSGRLITLTIGIRFLTDYLAGDTYFRTAYEDHNLVRCRTQLKMVESMEAQRGEYEAIVRDAAR